MLMPFIKSIEWFYVSESLLATRLKPVLSVVDHAVFYFSVNKLLSHLYRLGKDYCQLLGEGCF